MPNAVARPWKMFMPLALVLGLTLLWTLYWFMASAIARERLAGEREKLAAQGLTLTCTREEWGGFPFHFEFACSSPVAKYATRADVRSGNLLLVALAYAPWQWVALIDGPSMLAAEDILPTKAEHQRAIAAITFDDAWKPKLSSEIPAVSIAGLGKAEKFMLHTRPSAAGGTDIAVILTKPVYEAQGQPALALDQASLLGTLKEDGSFDIETLDMQQGTLRVRGKGSLALDAQHRVSGRIDTETNDLDALLTLLSPHLTLSAEQMNSLRTMLGLLGSEAKAPVIAKDGALYLGPFRIASLAPLY